MRTITWLCSAALLVPAVAAAAPAERAAPAEVVAAVVEGSIVGALVSGDSTPPVLRVERALSADRAVAPGARAGGTGGRLAQASAAEPRSGKTARAKAATPARDEAVSSGTPGAAFPAGNGSTVRDLGILLSAGLAGTLLFVAGGRRVRTRRRS